MTVSQAQFDGGMTYDAYKAQMTRNQDRLIASEKAVSIDAEDLAPFRALRSSINVLAIVEDWCGDVVSNVPVLARLAAETGKLNVRCILRDQHLDITDQYLNRGEFRSIPIFVFLDANFKDVGRFIERPASVTEARAKKRLEVFAANPEFGDPASPPDQLAEDVRGRLQAALQKTRDDLTPWANREVVRAIGAIVDGAA
jgi:hypothetical protein